MTRRCVFCGSPGDTKEHIIPRWLQKHFELKDQQLKLPNETTLKYCRALLPACKTCNSEKLSRLEDRVRRNIATDQEYFLWALKIRFCFSLVDSSFAEDRRQPDGEPILRREYASIGHEFILHAFNNLSKEQFYFRPYPFGSVFLRRNPIKDGGFAFVDVSHPHWGLTIALPGHRLLSVLFTDRGMVKQSLAARYKGRGGLAGFFGQRRPELPTNVYAQSVMFRLLIAQYQLSNIPYAVSLKCNGVYSRRVPNKLRYRKKLKRPVIFDIAKLCGLSEEIAQDIFNDLPMEYRG